MNSESAIDLHESSSSFNSTHFKQQSLHKPNTDVRALEPKSGTDDTCIIEKELDEWIPIIRYDDNCIDVEMDLPQEAVDPEFF